MAKSKIIIASVVTAGILAASGAYVNNSGVNTDEASNMELLTKKKKQKKNKNYSYYKQKQDNSWRNNNSNGGNGYNNAQHDNAKVYNYGSSKYGENIGLPAIRQGQMILRRKAYTALYDQNMRIPRWTAWHLTRQHTYGKLSRKNAQFTEDTSIRQPRATNFDYMSSGYDRGHMCPAGDNKWDSQALNESFLFSNCCPQRHNLNSGAWNDLEIRCREWAQKYGDIYIVCGPILRGTQHRTVGKNRVVVPEAFFKVVLCMNGTPKAIGFIYEHQGKAGNMASHACSVDKVEQITGYDFFAALPDNIENRIEASANFYDWR